MSVKNKVRARFECEPPADLRKSNFFHFRVELKTDSGAPLDVVCARFLHFLNEDPPQDRHHQLRNGIKYEITLKYPNGMTERRDLFLTLVDANTREPIRYEGHDDNPKMQRVLLTHEAICTRCSLNKSCGNKNEAPSDPAISGRGLLKFFLKCNQNCLKGAGNPRDTRRFAVALTVDGNMTLSRPMFVHNNSKHSRNKRKRDIAQVLHLVGPSPGGKVVVVGENFREGDRLFANDEAVLSLVRQSESVIEAWIPPSFAPTCRITLQRGDQFLEAGTLRVPVGPVACVSPSLVTFDFVSPRWAVPGISFACGQLPLPVLALVSGQTAKVALHPSLPPGFVTISVLWNGRPYFTFPYRILDREEFERLSMNPNPGFTCLYKREDCPPYGVLELDPHNTVVFVDEVDMKPALAPYGRYSDGGYYEPCRSYSSSTSSEVALHASPTL